MREFAIIALTGFRAVNDYSLSATNLSACLLFTKLLFYGPVLGAAAGLSTDQEIISVKHRLRWCSPTETVLFRSLICCTSDYSVLNKAFHDGLHIGANRKVKYFVVKENDYILSFLEKDF